jgi:hypothetical protein
LFVNDDEWPSTPHSKVNGAHPDPGIHRIVRKPFFLILFSLLTDFTRCLSLANATWGGFIEFFLALGTAEAMNGQ